MQVVARQLHRRGHVRAARDAGAGGRPGRRRRLAERAHRRRHPGPPEDRLADGRWRSSSAWQIQRDLRHHGHRGAVRRACRHRPRGCTSCSAAFAIVASSNAREHHRRPRRPVGRPAGLRLRRLHDHRGAQHLARPAEPGHPVRASSSARLLGFLWFNVHPARGVHRRLGRPGARARRSRSRRSSPARSCCCRSSASCSCSRPPRTSPRSCGSSGRARRLFRMAPLHHHFELLGLAGEKITLRFWIVGVLSALIGVAFYLGTRDAG